MMYFQDLEVLLDLPLSASVVRLFWEDGTETIEVVLADDAERNAGDIARVLAVVPDGFQLSTIDYDLEDTPLGVPGSMRTYTRKAASNAA